MATQETNSPVKAVKESNPPIDEGELAVAESEVEPVQPQSPPVTTANQSDPPEVTGEDHEEVDDDTGKESGHERGSDPWQAVFSPEANAWYFWNSVTNATTWDNPKLSSQSNASSSAGQQPPLPPPSTDPSALGIATETGSETSTGALPPIDPDLAWLDPAAAAASRTGAGGKNDLASRPQAARFNARTGRFQVDPSFNPDRISDFQRSNRQQEAYYDVKGWEQQLDGKGLKRTGEDDEDSNVEGSRKRPSSKQVERFKQQKQEKKKKKLTSWLGN